MKELHLENRDLLYNDAFSISNVHFIGKSNEVALLVISMNMRHDSLNFVSIV